MKSLGAVVLVFAVLIFLLILSLPDILPVGFGDFEDVEDGFGAQEAGSQCDGDDVAFAEFAGHGEGEADDGDLDEIVEEVAAVVESVAVGNFEDDSAGPAQALMARRSGQ